MADLETSLNEIMALDGALCCSIVDSNNGMLMAGNGSGLDIEIASAGNSEVVKAKLNTMKMLKLNDVIEDILITLGKQYHIIRPITTISGVFVYAVLDKNKANLALARRKIQDIEQVLQF
ncbi:hypothetical protein [Neisseria sp. Ec49-e6-T10]|uniref:hypothetical protein n=1 Tax=Neisseria sp. Ec49-e6-T10 TaxID=3140744 RepID=UPI003EB759B3